MAETEAGTPRGGLSPRLLRIETLELRVALGGRSAEAARNELEVLLAQEERESGKSETVT